MQGAGTKDEKESVPAGGWAALLAGAAPWMTDNPAATRLVSALEVLALAVTAGTVWHASRSARGAMSAGLAALCTLGVVLIATTPAARLLRVAPPTRNFRLCVAMRSVAVAVVTLASLALLRGSAIVLFLVNSIAFGADVALTAREVGWKPRAWSWWLSFVGSSFHWGIVGGLMAVLARAPGAFIGDAGPPFVLMHALLALTLVVASALGGLMGEVEEQAADAVAAALAVEHRQRAHWLHDDVCAQVRLASLRLQTGGLDQAGIAELLDDLDHSIRLQQLDQLIASGSVHVAEALQPFIRRAQNQHVTIAHVPSFDDIDFDMDENEATLFRRAVSILTSNALNAGATRLGFDIGVGEAFLTLTVSDDGRGFDSHMVTDGRGLWRLRNDLKPGGIQIGEVDRGASVTATIPISRKHHR